MESFEKRILGRVTKELWSDCNQTGAGKRQRHCFHSLWAHGLMDPRLDYAENFHSASQTTEFSLLGCVC